MWKQNKRKLLLSSVLILLPIAAGLLLWDRLPAQLATHWGADGNADGQLGRFAAILLPPLLLLAVHWLCLFFTARDPGNRGQSSKVFGLIFWICPVLSMVSSGFIYYTALGGSFRFDRLFLLLIGLFFALMGNWLPKCRRNSTIGIKVKWALENEENWNATHRLGGRVWVAGGLLTMVCAFLPEAVIPWTMLVLLIVMAALPTAYSYAYYRRQLAAGTVSPSAPNRKRTAMTLVFSAALLIFLAVMLLTGSVHVRFDEQSFTVNATYWSDLTVEYDAIEALEYREHCPAGSRTNGFGSFRLALGSFHNDEFGSYTRYSYTGCDACVILTVDGRTLVLSGKNEAETQAIYQTLTQYWP